MKKLLYAILIVVIVAPFVVYFAFPQTMLNLTRDLETRLAGLTEKSIMVDKFTISYMEGGRGDNVVLLHGYTADKSNWVRFARYLTPKYHVIILDLPGFGRSSHIENESYTIAAQAERLNKIVDALKLPKFHLAGNSMGGSISGRYTAGHPDRVLTLGLFDSGGVYSCPHESEFYKNFQKGKNQLLVDKAEDFDRVLKIVFVKPPFIPLPIKKYLAEQSVKNRQFNEKIGQQITKEQYKLEPDLGKIKVKTLILWGDKDQLIDVSCVQLIEKGLSNHTTAIMKDCGHIPMVERPSEAAYNYLKFLKGT